MRLGFRYLLLKLSLLTVAEGGQDLVEYALIAGLIGCACIATTNSFAKLLLTSFNSISATFTSTVGPNLH